MSGQRVAYIRVSSLDQNVGRQLDGGGAADDAAGPLPGRGGPGPDFLAHDAPVPPARAPAGPSPCWPGRGSICGIRRGRVVAGSAAADTPWPRVMAPKCRNASERSFALHC